MIWGKTPLFWLNGRGNRTVSQRVRVLGIVQNRYRVPARSKEVQLALGYPAFLFVGPQDRSLALVMRHDQDRVCMHAFTRTALE